MSEEIIRKSEQTDETFTVDVKESTMEEEMPTSSSVKQTEQAKEKMGDKDSVEEEMASTSFATKPEKEVENFSDDDNQYGAEMPRNISPEASGMISSDSEAETYQPRASLTMDILKEIEVSSRAKIHVPGLRAPPLYPRMSALTVRQHHQCLKVLCARNPEVLEMEVMMTPTQEDETVLEGVKDLYNQEKMEFKEYAKNMWPLKYQSRALNTKPNIELVYTAEFEMRAISMKSFPKTFKMRRAIDFTPRTAGVEMQFQEDLVVVHVADLPRMELPDISKEGGVFLNTCPVPKPCFVHPCWFLLPNKPRVCELPMTVVHRELAQYTYDRDCRIIASEGALKSLMEMDRDWLLPLTVCEIYGGDKKNILVIGSDFFIRRKSAYVRNYRALRHVLDHALIPHEERERIKRFPVRAFRASMDRDINQIDEVNGGEPGFRAADSDNSTGGDSSASDEGHVTENGEASLNAESDDNFDFCRCKESTFENPPARSYRKWQLYNEENNDRIDIIVHNSHKLKGSAGEVIAEPIVDYQIELGGTKQSHDKIKSLALSLFLRKEASVLNVRIDNMTGEIVTMDTLTLEEITNENEDIIQEISGNLYDVLNQLKDLESGHYILEHEISYGPKAYLFTSRAAGPGRKLHLSFNSSALLHENEMHAMAQAPEITDVLLPMHKHRKMLPCAFPPYKDMVEPETRQKKPFARKNKKKSSAKSSQGAGTSSGSYKVSPAPPIFFSKRTHIYRKSKRQSKGKKNGDLLKIRVDEEVVMRRRMWKRKCQAQS